jgi:hypothetical protein
MKNVTVKILVTVNDFSHFDACTLCFETLRVGWPTADIYIFINGAQYQREILDKLEYFHREDKGRIFWHVEQPVVHLADWIRTQVNLEYPGPLVIADPDIVYWKSCEDWEFPESVLLAGYYHPRMWNDFAKCVSTQRIHTSMMVFPDTNKLATAVLNTYPLSRMKHGEYCPCDPFMGRVMFDEGKPTFWDCCAVLYAMLCKQSDSVFHFGHEYLECFDHLNSASFYDCMFDRLEGETKEGFKFAHREWVKNPTPGLWPLVDAYYKQRAIEAWVVEKSDRPITV